jgi:EAL domain-containing protein (putative c-di-GMP-specific phosphodiesterase class I)
MDVRFVRLSGEHTLDLGEADIAMFGAKEDVAVSSVVDAHVRAEVVGRLSTAGALRSALRGHGLNIAYQPIVSLATGRIAALEAFARWTTSTGTSVSPEVFIPVAEENGLIVELGSQILAMAARDAATWQQIAPTGLRVNVSVHELRSHNFYDDVMRKLHRAGLDPALLGLEVTESVLAQEGAPTRDVLARLRGTGISVMLDDFGGDDAGGRLAHIPPVDMLKLDRSFISDLDREDEVVDVIREGRAMGLKVCAEGVENAPQHKRAAALGCDYAQGYYFARPIAGDMVPKMLQTWAPFLP